MVGMKGKWRLVTGTVIGPLLGAILSPACGMLCQWQFAIGGSLVGLVAGLVLDVLDGLRKRP